MQVCVLLLLVREFSWWSLNCQLSCKCCGQFYKMETLSSDVTSPPKRKRLEAAATPDIKRKRLKKRRERRRTSSAEHRSTSASPKCDGSSEESDSFYQEAPHLRATVSLQWRHFQVRLFYEEKNHFELYVNKYWAGWQTIGNSEKWQKTCIAHRLSLCPRI